MSFEDFNLNSSLLPAIEQEGLEIPTPIQIEAIPAAIEGRDIIGTAQTGTGKTAAFVLPILNRLLTGPLRRVRALIVTPTRELAHQIHDMTRAFSKGTRIRCSTVYGGVNAVPQIKALKSGVEIIVACPGRLLDHIEHGKANLSGVEVLVLDEGDRMLDMGFLPDVRKILKYVPAKRQTMLFSATFPREIEQLAKATLHDPKRIAIGLARPVYTVSHALYPVPQHLKSRLLFKILEHTDTESVLVFTRTKHRAKRLAGQLDKAGYRTTSLHSNRTQNQRQSALKGFKRGIFQIMVATDIAARGLDIASVSHVINFDMPDTADAYIHRIGRTGRAEKTGDAFTLAAPEDKAMVKALEKIMDQDLPRMKMDGFDYDVKPHRNQTPRGTYPQKKRSASGDPRKNRSGNKKQSRRRNRGYKGGRTGRQKG